MGIGVGAWRSSIGRWSARCRLRLPTADSIDFSTSAIFFGLVLAVLLVVGGIELNPGPKSQECCEMCGITFETLKTREQRVEEREAACAAQDRALVEREAASDTRDRALVERKAMLVAREHLLKLREGSSTAREKTLDGRETAAVAREQILSEREAACIGREAAYVVRVQNLNEREASSIAREQILGEREVTSVAREQNLGKREAASAVREQALGERENGLNVDMFRALLEKGILPQVSWSQLLYWAVECHLVTLVRFLVDEVHITADCDALSLAVRHGMLPAVQMMLPTCREIVELGAFHEAVSGGHVELVRCLVQKYNILVRLKDKFGNTALHRAAKAGQVEMAHFLVHEAQADRQAKDRAGRTALSLARSHEMRNFLSQR